MMRLGYIAGKEDISQIDKTEEYIKYRLQVAGSNVNIFNSAAAEEIYAFSGGYPRLINIICDNALLAGYVKAKKEIGSQIIRECAEELQIPIKSYEKENAELPYPAAGRNPKEISEKIQDDKWETVYKKIYREELKERNEF